MRNGEPDPSFTRAAQRAYLAETLKTTASRVIQATGRAVSVLVTPVILDAYDAMHGTELRDEYFERRQRVAESAMRSLVEL